MKQRMLTTMIYLLFWAVRLSATGVVAADEKIVDVDIVIAKAFAEVHDGWSTDEVLLQDKLNERFIARCQQDLHEVKVSDLNWRLLNLRKAKKLSVKVTRRSRHNHDKYRHAAEIAARLMEDKHGLNTDRVLCDPTKRTEFDHEATRVAPGVEPYLLRKAALGLRKARRLKPEFVVRVADWGREVSTWPAARLASDISLASKRPGVYIFRDQTGYLYIGEAANLRARLKQHLDESDRASLASHLKAQGLSDVQIELHAFESKSAARKVSNRRAYESELIRSRKPRFNIRP